MRRAVTVPAKLIQQLLRLAIRRAGVTRGQLRAESVASLGIGFDAAAQVVFRLRRIEERVSAQGVGMPHIDNGTGDRLPVHVAHLPVHEQRFALLAAVIEPYFALGQRCNGDIKRAFDRARRAAFDACLALSLIHAQIEEGFDAETRHREWGFVRLTECADVADGRPEFVGLDIKICLFAV